MEKTFTSGFQFRKHLSLVFACLLPFLWYIENDVFVYAFMTYVAFVFYEAENFNIRFVIALVAIEGMLALLLVELVKVLVHDVLQLEDITPRVIGIDLIKGSLQIFLVWAIIRRNRLIDWFTKKVDSSHTPHLSGTEMLLIGTALAVLALHIFKFSTLLGAMIEVTNYDSMYVVFQRENYAFYNSIFNNLYLVVTMFQIFAIQSYNYKVFRRQWSISA